jgi:hypothetical protein
MEKVQELFVILEDKPNALGALLNILANNRIKVESIGVFVDSAKLLVDNVDKTQKILLEKNYAVEVRESVKVRVENSSKELAYITERIGHVGINISHAYGTSDKTDKKMTLILDVSDVDMALSLFDYNHH